MNAQAQAQAQVERLKKDLKQVAGDAEALLSEVSSSTTDKFDVVRDKIETRLRTAKATLDEAKEAVTDRTREAMETTEEYVGEHPWQSIAVAAAVGVVIGMLIRRH